MPTSRFFHGEDHSAYRGEFLEACRVGRGSAALGRVERGAQLVHRLIMLYEAVRQLGELQALERVRMSDKLNAALDEGREIGATAYAAALGRRDS